MKRYIDIPEQIASDLNIPQGNGQQRHVLEAYVAAKYNEGLLTSFQVGQLLGHETRWDTDKFLKDHHCPSGYTDADLEADLNIPDSLFKPSK